MPLALLALLVVGAAAYIALYGDRAFVPPSVVGDAVSALLPERERVREALRAAGDRFLAAYDPRWPTWLDALGWVESRWRLDAVNRSGADGARGGAWGPTQITERTARGVGFAGDISQLTVDPGLAAEWTARIMLSRPGGPPPTAEDAAAWWNAGRASFDALPADHVTRTEYAPRLLAAIDGIAGGSLA